MTDLYIFEYYDPKLECVPEYFEASFYNAHAFASDVLINRSKEEIAALLIDIDDHLCEVCRDLQGFHRKDFIECAPADTAYLDRTSTVYLLRQMLHHKNPSHITNVSGATWAECFAAVCLGLISFACRHEEGLLSEQIEEAEIMEMIAMYIGCAQEASTIAAMLSNKPGMLSQAIDTVKFNRSVHKETGRKGGIARSKKFEPLKQKVIEITEANYGGKSARHAAKLVYKQLTDEDLVSPNGSRLFTTDEPESTIARWIAQHRRQKNNS